MVAAALVPLELGSASIFTCLLPFRQCPGLLLAGWSCPVETPNSRAAYDPAHKVRDQSLTVNSIRTKG